MNHNIKITLLFAILTACAVVSVILRDSMGFVFSLFMCVIALASVFVPETDRKFVLMTLLLSFLVRVVAAYIVHVHSWHRGFEGLVSGDDRLYSLKALKMALIWQHLPYSKISDLRGEVYGINAYTYVLAFIYRIFEPNYFYSKLYNCLLGSITPLLVYSTCKRLFSSPAAKIAMLLAAFYPSFILWSTANYKDTFIIFLVAALFYFLFSMRKNLFAVINICAILLILYLLKNLQSLYVHAFVGGVFIYVVIVMLRMLRSRFLVVLTLALSAIYTYVCYEFAKPKILQFLEFMTVYQDGMFRADNAGYMIYSEKVFEMLRKGVVYIPGFVYAYIKGLIYVVFSPFPWSITSMNQLVAYPEVALWYFLLAFSVFGFIMGLKKMEARTAMAILFVFLGLSILAMWEGNVGAAFRHRDYFAPVIFIFASAAAVNIFYKRIGEE